MELAVEAWVQMSQPESVRVLKLTLPTAHSGAGWPSQSSAGSWPWWYRQGRTYSLTSLTTTQAQIQGSELAHQKIYIICEWLGHVKGPILLLRSK